MACVTLRKGGLVIQYCARVYQRDARTVMGEGQTFLEQVIVIHRFGWLGGIYAYAT